MSFDETFAADGCLTIPKLFDSELIAAIHDEYLRQFGSLQAEELPAYLVVGDRRMQCPIQVTGPLLDPALYANPLILGILSGLLGHDPIIDNISCVIAYSGAGEQHSHRDHPALFLGSDRSLRLVPPFAITVAIPLVDLSPVTGTTELYPGSHMVETDPDGAPLNLAEPRRPYIKRGGCFLMDYRLWHCGMPNQSQDTRPVLYIVYARHWFTDMINFQSHSRIHLEFGDAMKIPLSARRLFRRLAVKGAYDLTVSEFTEPLT